MSFINKIRDAERINRLKTLRPMGYAFIRTGNYTQATWCFKQVRNLCQTLNDPESEVGALVALGHIECNLGQYKQAMQYADEAIQLAQKHDDDEGISLACSLLGICHLSLSQYDEALTCFKYRLSIAQKYHDHDGEVGSLMNIGAVYHGQSKYQQALEYYDRAKKIVDTLQNPKQKGLVLNNLGRLYFHQGNLLQAKKYLDESLNILRKVRSRHDLANVLEDQGNLLFALGDYQQALSYLEEAYTTLHAIKELHGEVSTLNALGTIARTKGDYLRAISYRKRQLVLAQKIGVPLLESLALGNLGTIYQVLGDFTEAERIQQQQLTFLRTQIKDPNQEATCLGNLGNTYLLLKQYDKSAACNQESLAIAHAINNPSGQIAALVNLANLANAQYNDTLALTYLEQAKTIAQQGGDPALMMSVIQNIGVTNYSQGNYSKALEYDQQALDLARKLERPPDEGTALHNMGLTYFQDNKLPEAEAALFAAIHIWETLRSGLQNEDAYKISLFDQQAKTYANLQEVLITQNKIEQALEVAERGRTQALVALLERSFSAQAKSAAVAHAQSIDITGIKRVAQEQQATIIEYAFTFLDSREQVKKRYPGGEVFIWVIKPTGEVYFERSDYRPFYELVTSANVDLAGSLRDHLGVRGRDATLVNNREAEEVQVDDEELLHFLYKQFVAPIKDYLPADPEEHVIIVPQQFLFLLPFAAFCDEQKRPLIERHTLRVIPSIQVLALTQKPAAQAGSFVDTEALIVGNPTMPALVAPDKTKQPLPQLPGAEAEAIAIAHQLHSVALIGQQATKEAVITRMSTALLIHFATHGLLDPEQSQGIPGAIALTPIFQKGQEDEYSGWLTSEDILLLTLRARLVVLSACDTGQGRVTGDGIIGLSRAFLTAGVPSMIVSLWSIPDAPTAFFMSTFYQELEHNPDIARALRQAMLITRDTYPDPLVWAPFILIGHAL